jgi:hypothetical protein
MTSDKKVQANRQNALKSTGPKTPEGKARVRHNALRHGLLAREVLLPEEDQEALSDLDERLRAELRPEGEMEDLLVEQIITAQWRLRRMRRVEAGVFDYESSSAFSEVGCLYPLLRRGTSLLGMSFSRDANGAKRFLQALPLRDRNRAKPLQGTTRAAAPPGCPPRRGKCPTARGCGRGRLRGFKGRPLRDLALFRKT